MASNILLRLAAACLVFALAHKVAHAALDVTPENTVAKVGDTIQLICSVVDAAVARLVWNEFATTPGGTIVSDGRTLSPGHPNVLRYSILGADPFFILEIRNVTLGDGGTYMCQDFNAVATDIVRGYLEVTILEDDPTADDISGGEDFALVESQFYSSTCQIIYSGHMAPQITVTGPGEYQVDSTTTPTVVSAYLSFSATRDMIGGQFVCTTNFQATRNGKVDFTASNIPDYEFIIPSTVVDVHWAPQNMAYTPVKPTYDVGDTLTCTCDSNPAATFVWTNLGQTLDVPGQVFTITIDLVGSVWSLRCNARLLLNGGLYTQDLFVNVTVNALTTTPPTTPIPSSTTPAAYGNCTDLTGLWKSTNPDADLCIEVDGRGNVLTLIRNGTDTTFVVGNGKTMVGDYKHIGFVATWLAPLGVAGFVGECHSCYGVEAILISGLSRNYYNSPGCGTSAGISFTKLYVFTRNGGPCRGMELAIANPKPYILEQMGVRALPPKNPIQL